MVKLSLITSPLSKIGFCSHVTFTSVLDVPDPRFDCPYGCPFDSVRLFLNISSSPHTHINCQHAWHLQTERHYETYDEPFPLPIAVHVNLSAWLNSHELHAVMKWKRKQTDLILTRAW